MFFWIYFYFFYFSSVLHHYHHIMLSLFKVPHSLSLKYRNFTSHIAPIAWTIYPFQYFQALCIKLFSFLIYPYFLSKFFPIYHFSFAWFCILEVCFRNLHETTFLFEFNAILIVRLNFLLWFSWWLHSVHPILSKG